MIQFPSSILAAVEETTDTGFGRGVGDGGNISIETDRLTISDGAEITAPTFGDGQAGNISINATENISLSGINSISGNSSAITASTEVTATGEGGNITITTPSLNLDNGAVITARTRSEFSAGDLVLNVDTLNLTNGAQIFTSSFSDGNAGTITIDADSPITVSGTDPDFHNREVQNFDRETGESAIASQTTSNGNAGSITINTPQLRVENQGIITVSSSGRGVAGSLNINAPSIELNNGTLSAETTAGNQGNITIQASEINLENNSAITTNATESATGGDININAQFIVSSDNSNISANAIEGQGGNISINAEGVFLDTNSQITATSTLGIDGTVNINTQVDPTQGVVKLSATVIDAESLMANNICALTKVQREGSLFVISGRGGLPPDPTQPLTVLRGTVEWETNTQISKYENKARIVSHNRQPVRVYHRRQSADLPEINQAQGWIMTQNGAVTLTSTSTIVNSATPQLIHPSCYLFITKNI